MRKTPKQERVLARVLAEELERVKGGANPTYETVGESGRKDITDANNGDKPPV